MLKIREKLEAALGLFGFVVFYIILGVITFMPLVFLPIPWWVDFIVVAVVLAIGNFGSIILIAAWVWSFFVVINTPFDFRVLLYIISAVITFLGFIPPMIAVIIARKNEV